MSRQRYKEIGFKSRGFQWSAPPIVPLSRTSVWLASRSSIARCSRVECSSESLVCRDLYKFILELLRPMRVKKGHSDRVNEGEIKSRSNHMKTDKNVPHMVLDL